jgi:CTP:molybdopterin cytidylyltransferase MocA
VPPLANAVVASVDVMMVIVVLATVQSFTLSKKPFAFEFRVDGRLLVTTENPLPMVTMAEAALAAELTLTPVVCQPVEVPLPSSITRKDGVLAQ